jgi:hypothetical protein
MLNKVFAEIKSFKICWVGVSTNKEGKQSPQCQGILTALDGKVTTAFVSLKENNGKEVNATARINMLADKIAVGKTVDLYCGVRAFENALYLDYVSAVVVPDENVVPAALHGKK